MYSTTKTPNRINGHAPAASSASQQIKQNVHKRLLDKYRLPRLSLFYM